MPTSDDQYITPSNALSPQGLSNLQHLQAGLQAQPAQRLGFEEAVDQKDLIIPRAKLLQALSPEVNDTSLTVRAGQIINSLTKEVLPEEFVVIKRNKAWIKFNPRNSNDPDFDTAYKAGAMIWKVTDPTDPRTKTEDAWKHQFLNFLCIFNGCSMPVTVSFSKTSYTHGKNLLSLLEFQSGNIFSRKFRLISETQKNEKGQFYVMKTAPAGATDGDLYSQAFQMYNDFNRVDLSEHVETPQEETTTTQAPY